MNKKRSSHTAYRSAKDFSLIPSLPPTSYILPPSCFIFLLALIITAYPALAAEPDISKKVLIIGIDGCRPDALQAARTPALDSLVRDGAVSYTTQTGDITVSGPGWSSLLTGVWRDKHGVDDNEFRQPHYDQYPALFTRLEKARPEAVTTSIVHWSPINEHIVRLADYQQQVGSDLDVALVARSRLTVDNPDLLFLHFDEVDDAGHSHGFDPENPKYIEAIEATDRHVQFVLDALRSRKTYAEEDWLVLVSTDHGGTEKEHGKNIPTHRTIFFIASGPSAARGPIDQPTFIVDIAATALVHLGIPIDPAWQLDGRAVGLKK